MATRILSRGGTAAQWTAANPVLSAKELGVESDTGQAKVGNGVTAWTSLPYVGSVAAAVNAAAITAETSRATTAENLKLAKASNLSDVASASTALANLGGIPLTQKAAANGVATLDANSLIPANQIPPIAISNYLGAVVSQAAMLALSGERGDWCTRTDLASTFIVVGEPSSSIGNWQALPTPTDAVLSVNGRVGAVTGSRVGRQRRCVGAYRTHARLSVRRDHSIQLPDSRVADNGRRSLGERPQRPGVGPRSEVHRSRRHMDDGDVNLYLMRWRRTPATYNDLLARRPPSGTRACSLSAGKVETRRVARRGPGRTTRLRLKNEASLHAYSWPEEPRIMRVMSIDAQSRNP